MVSMILFQDRGVDEIMRKLRQMALMRGGRLASPEDLHSTLDTPNEIFWTITEVKDGYY